MVRGISDKIKGISKLNIIRVFSLTSISTIVKMIAGFVSVKVISVIIGPSGVALLGQLNNFSSIIQIFASGGINGGVTKYIAEFKDDKEQVKSYIGTAVQITLVVSIVFGLCLIIASSYLGNRILLDKKYAFVFIIFGVTLIFYTLNALLLSILNGFKLFRLFVIISIVSSLFGLIISVGLVFLLGINGALINAITSQSFLFFIALFIVRNQRFEWFSKAYLLSGFKTVAAKKYLKFVIMSLVAAVGLPVAQLIIRSYLMKKFSMQEAGCWEGMNRLSNMYLMVITSSFGVYYLPRLSEIHKPALLRREIFTAYKIIIPFLMILLPLIYVSRNLIITALFSNEFRLMNRLFAWQLIGDFFKISSWLIGYLMAAKAMMKLFVSTETIFSFSYIGLVMLLCPVVGFRGVVIGYAVNYAAYLLTMYALIYRQIQQEPA